MNCFEYRDAIAEFIEGTLDADGQRALERHVESCAACRALVADLKSIQAAAFTLDRHEPPTGVWERVRDRVAAEPRSDTRGRVLVWPRSRAAWGIWAAAAAALLITTVTGVYPLINERRHRTDLAAGSQPSGDVASIQAEFQAAEEHYDRAIQGLEQIARSQSGDLDPQVAAVLQKNLQVIDQAIGESRSALKMQPSSTDAQDSLFDAMRTKVAVLQQTVELINEMRKGNQAEAGRLIKGLNQ
ncbi:MAG TPA: zf-HC2 domain-containing protein [Vicinamibacterales bacterium]|nr:zf-HC2 domain-containing protein [Vicinamibacterales bacterium]